MIDGAVRITNRGFNEPESIKLATLIYRHEEDHIAKFIDERIIVASTGSVTKATVFNAYKEWCVQNGEKNISQNAVAREIRSRLNVGETEGSGIRMFTGIEILDLTMTAQSMVEEEDRDRYWK